MVILENRDKVFIIGAHKTGTTSLDRSLQILGYNTYPTWLSYKENGLIEDFKIENMQYTQKIGLREYPKPISSSEFKYLYEFYKKPNADLFNFLGYEIKEWK
jgi:hypothetical protein